MSRLQDCILVCCFIICGYLTVHQVQASCSCLCEAHAGNTTGVFNKWSKIRLASASPAMRAKLRGYASDSLHAYCTAPGGTANSSDKPKTPCDVTLKEAYSRAGRGIIATVEYCIKFTTKVEVCTKTSCCTRCVNKISTCTAHLDVPLATNIPKSIVSVTCTE